MSSTLIKLIAVSKNYLPNLIFNLEIKKSSFWLITGSNGSGKTTLLRLILGFLKPDQGQIIKNKRLKIGYLPEKASLPYFIKTIDYLTIIGNMKKHQLDFTLFYNLAIPLSKKIGHLSKGNYQKVALASTLLGDNDIVILDEPLTGLDKKTINAFKKIIKKGQDQGISYIVSTHNPNVFLKMADNHLEL